MAVGTGFNFMTIAGQHIDGAASYGAKAAQANLDSFQSKLHELPNIRLITGIGKARNEKTATIMARTGAVNRPHQSF